MIEIMAETEVCEIIINPTELKESFSILGVKNDELVLSTGHTIGTYHEQDCCERVYADWSVLDMQTGVFGKRLRFLVIRPVDDGLVLEAARYPFGMDKIFIPCYSEQNGYCSDALSLDIKMNGDLVRSFMLPDRAVKKMYDWGGAMIAIKDFEMPKNCCRCPMAVYDEEFLFCTAKNYMDFIVNEVDAETKRHPKCPLVEITDHVG